MNSPEFDSFDHYDDLDDQDFARLKDIAEDDEADRDFDARVDYLMDTLNLPVAAAWKRAGRQMPVYQRPDSKSPTGIISEDSSTHDPNVDLHP